MFLMQAPPPPSPQAATITVFEADRLEIRPGERVELKWKADGLDAVRLDPLTAPYPSEGHLVVQPSVTTTYWLSAVNERGGMTTPLTIRVVEQAQKEAPRADAFWVQFAAFYRRARAERMVLRLSSCLHRPVIIQSFDDANRPVYRVRVGPFGNVRLAKQRLRRWTRAVHAMGLLPVVASS